jgi:hypothetical protein
LYNPLCKDYTIEQGPETWNFHAVDPLAKTNRMYDAECKWSGQMSSADLTCTFAAKGENLGTHTGTTTSTIKASEMASNGKLQRATIVNPTQTLSGTSSDATPSTQSSGFAAPGPLPTGVITFCGGVAGFYAAALAL